MVNSGNISSIGLFPKFGFDPKENKVRKFKVNNPRISLRDSRESKDKLMAIEEDIKKIKILDK